MVDLEGWVSVPSENMIFPVREDSISLPRHRNSPTSDQLSLMHGFTTIPCEVGKWVQITVPKIEDNLPLKSVLTIHHFYPFVF